MGIEAAGDGHGHRVAGVAMRWGGAGRGWRRRKHVDSTRY